MYEVILKHFETPDEIRTFDKGKFEIVNIGGMTVGRATYQPGWKWSLHVGAATGAKSCQCGACWDGRLRPRHRCHERREHRRDEAGRHLLHRSRAR